MFTDIDDTLTSDGAITPNALAALHGLHTAGLTVMAVTGRPVGWSEPFALSWPLQAIVAENGAVALLNQRGKLSKIYQQDEHRRATNFARLQRAAARVLQEVPGTMLARDSA